MSTPSAMSGSDFGRGATPRICTECGEPISPKRLQAVPSAQQCTSCLESMGDVPKLKRFDETCGEEVVSTFYTHNTYIEHQTERINSIAAPDAAFDVALGDDSMLVREKTPTSPVAARSLSSVFENEEDDDEGCGNAVVRNPQPNEPSPEDMAELSEDVSDFPLPMAFPPDTAIAVAHA